MTKTENLRAAWNAYVFARAGMAPGAGMKITPEPVAYEALTTAIHSLLDAEWMDEDTDERERAETYDSRFGA
jgi:hypothetical protein